MRKKLAARFLDVAEYANCSSTLHNCMSQVRKVVLAHNPNYSTKLGCAFFIMFLSLLFPRRTHRYLCDSRVPRTKLLRMHTPGASSVAFGWSSQLLSEPAVSEREPSP